MNSEYSDAGNGRISVTKSGAALLQEVYLDKGQKEGDDGFKCGHCQR